MFLLHPQESLSFAIIRAGRAMVASRLAERQNRRVLEMIVVLIRACRGHHELVLENLALRQQLHALKRTGCDPQIFHLN